ncbi:MAG: hypothetical protein J6X44_01805 [Thermoguttaceae bacterium]|nr:hypothetical protein [Thermoguttaceae bacterium]
MRSQASQTRRSRRQVDESKRRDLKRIALVLGAVLFGSTLVVSSGCKSTSPRRNDKTIDDFLSDKKPQW